MGFGTVEEEAADIPGYIDRVEGLEEDILLVVEGMENLREVSIVYLSPKAIANLRP